MDNIHKIEILLAQKLSSGEPNVRKRAFSSVQKYINSQSSRNRPLSREDFLRIWKGLYYCFWLQDKPLLQEDLVDRMAQLVDSIRDDDQKLLFVECFFEEMGIEWFHVDQWRLDKFLMAFRRIFRRLLLWLNKKSWNVESTERVLNLLTKFLLNSNTDSYPEGLKLHFVSMYMDELDNAGAETLNSEKVFEFLKPFFTLLSDRKTSDALFETILEEVFKAILEYSIQQTDDCESPGSSKPSLEFDLPRLKSTLFDVGKSKSTIAKRRVKLYEYVKNYEMLIAGEDPFAEEISADESLVEFDLDKAASRLTKTNDELIRKTKGNKRKRV